LSLLENPPGNFDMFLWYFVPPGKFQVLFEKIFHNFDRPGQLELFFLPLRLLEIL